MSAPSATPSRFETWMDEHAPQWREWGPNARFTVEFVEKAFAATPSESGRREKIELMQRDVTLERCAEICERQVKDDEAHGRMQARSILGRAAASIRALKSSAEVQASPDKAEGALADSPASPLPWRLQDAVIFDATGESILGEVEGQPIEFPLEMDADYIFRAVKAFGERSAIGRRHWVYAAAEEHRPLAARVIVTGQHNGAVHLLWMLDQIKYRNRGLESPTKACRWLGWIQACLYVAGVASLEDLKAINKRSSDRGAPTK